MIYSLGRLAALTGIVVGFRSKTPGLARTDFTTELSDLPEHLLADWNRVAAQPDLKQDSWVATTTTRLDGASTW